MHRTLVKVGQQSLTVAHKEVELVWGQLPQDQGTDLQLVSPALQNKLVSQAAWEGAQHKFAQENIFHRSLCSMVLPVQVTCVQRQPALAVRDVVRRVRLLIGHWLIPLAHSDSGRPVLGADRGGVQGAPGAGQLPAPRQHQRP